MLKGIDISKWQKGIDLSKIETDFVICKATEGAGYTDTTCDSFYQSAKNLGKKLGVYHFARPDLGNSAEVEADYFIKETKGYHKEAILILDWEPQGKSIGNVAWAKAWLDRVYNVTGVKPLIYMSASVMRSYDWSTVSNSDYGLWLANYGVNNGQANQNVFNSYPLKFWTFYALWQYTSNGRLNGYNGNLDMNYFSGDTTSWDKYAGSKSSSNKSDKKSIDEIANEVIADKWGTKDTFPTRKERLESAGYNYQEIQDRVNQKLGINKNRLESEVKDTRNFVNLPPTIDSWKIYDVNATPVKKNAKATLNPKKFGGLSYYVHEYRDNRTTAVIETVQFGRVKIYIKDTVAKITVGSYQYKNGNH